VCASPRQDLESSAGRRNLLLSTVYCLLSGGLLLELAIRAAREAGELLRASLGRDIEVRKKGPIDLVTDVDVASERLIKGLIATYYPRHAVLGEETGVSGADSEYLWIVDPLDGTTNYAHGYPCFCVSIGVERRGEMVLGVVYDPTRDELFVAERGAGATLNNRRIRVSDTAPLGQSLLVTGFPYNISLREFTNLEHFRNFCVHAQAVRRDGSAALDLCYVACGRFDGFWELALSPWDTAAGTLIVAEAGGRVTAFEGRPFDVRRPEVVASNGLVHDEMLAVLRLAPELPGGENV
jgi:myo-inositol-1(or 4)-monophosphatase